MKNSIIFSLAIIVASFLLGKAYVDRNKKEGEIRVTGLGTADFTSDLIVWECRFSTQNEDLKQGYLTLKKHQNIIDKYLTEKGVKSNEIIYSAVRTNKRMRTIYNAEGNYVGEEPDGYELSQSVKIESKNVNKIEKISREITSLLNEGIQLYSDHPRYYYTKLSQLKIDMISKATKDAKIRAEKIAEFSGGELGELQSAKMGVFQITGQNSKENYSWGGTFNTSSKEKTASITMKLVYKTD